jgi:NAD(P)-dependent dehydrogenase (short-subunit alcohol dehydrogenase family)
MCTLSLFDARIALILRRFRGMSWSVDDLPDLGGRFAVVTGGNSGVGWQAAKALAAHGCQVLLACRDVDRAEAAAQRIRVAHPGADVDVARLDLSSMASVREFGESRVEPIDLLVNNAGVMAPPRRVTTIDGFELQFATNHLGHFALTGLLLPMLMQAPSPRVVTVSSLAHRSGGTDVVDANAMGPYHAGHSYSNTKLANLLFAQELQRRSHANGSRLISTAAHPGLSATGLVKDSSGMGSNLVIRLIGSPVMRVVAQSAAAGALPTLYASTFAAPGSYTGPQHLGETRGDIGPARVSGHAGDSRLAHRLWGVSEDLTGFRYLWPRESISA